jgi:hypothetical protein
VHLQGIMRLRVIVDHKQRGYPAVFTLYLLFGAVQAGAARLDHEESE